MSSLKFPEKKLLEDLLNMGGGYVLDFTDRDFSTFFKDFSIDIDADKYHQPYGSSKAKRMRSFWEQEPDNTVGSVLEGILMLAEQSEIKPQHQKIVERLLGKKAQDIVPTEDDFLGKTFADIDLRPLQLDAAMAKVMDKRISEIQRCMHGKAWLSVVILSGSSLEGVLLDLASKHPKEFNQSSAAPKDKDRKVKQFQNWSLSDLINAAHETRFLGLDVKKFSHALRDFRNFIHPYEQAIHKFVPDEHTAKISWQVLRAALDNLSGKRQE